MRAGNSSKEVKKKTVQRDHERELGTQRTDEVGTRIGGKASYVEVNGARSGGGANEHKQMSE